MVATKSLPHLLALAILFMPSTSFALGTEFVRPRPLLEYEDILLAQQLNSSVSSLNDLLTQCVDSSSGNSAECYCRHPKEAQAVKNSYETTLQARPKWKGKILYWKDPADMKSHNLVMPAIEHQLKSSTLSCDSTR